MYKNRTDKTINTLLNIVSSGSDQGGSAMSIYLDITLAFKLVDRRVLLRKFIYMSSCGFGFGF